MHISANKHTGTYTHTHARTLENKHIQTHTHCHAHMHPWNSHPLIQHTHSQHAVEWSRFGQGASCTGWYHCFWPRLEAYSQPNQLITGRQHAFCMVFIRRTRGLSDCCAKYFQRCHHEQIWHCKTCWHGASCVCSHRQPRNHMGHLLCSQASQKQPALRADEDISLHQAQITDQVSYIRIGRIVGHQVSTYTSVLTHLAVHKFACLLACLHSVHTRIRTHTCTHLYRHMRAFAGMTSWTCP